VPEYNSTFGRIFVFLLSIKGLPNRSSIQKGYMQIRIHFVGAPPGFYYPLTRLIICIYDFKFDLRVVVPSAKKL